MAQAPSGSQDSNALIWIDLEMTGLNSDTDRIIEVATIITDSELNIVAEGPVMAVHQSDALLAGMDDWNQRTHAGTGLIERVKQSPYSEADVERLTLEFIQMHVPVAAWCAPGSAGPGRCCCRTSGIYSSERAFV